ncbi:hypothetical protein Scep_001226 [Stephania cephalantha]|uniref:Uncharacterized protein n=1 Tax=Stephania cephalantha TaxID=152367 RepID=A0AAP0LAB6_9MAGN
MLGLDGQIPSRHELLSMVKKHSKLLGKTIVDEEDSSDLEMDSRFWRDLLELYFIQGRESRDRGDDDLVFFVRKLGLHGYGFNDKMEGDSPYFVRRWASKLEKVVDENYAGVDWRRSFYLNLIAHTSYTEVETVPAYPDICFAVDDFDSTFGAVVLTETDQCYCVLLNAHDGAGFPSENGSSTSSSTVSSHAANDSNSGMPNSSKLTVFSGFVSYQMVREAYDAGKSRFGSLLSASHSSGKTDRLYMKGPGGRGEVEVAVSGVAEMNIYLSLADVDQSQQVSDPPSPLHISRRGLGIGLGTIVRKAASVASVAAKHAYAAAATKRFDEELLPLNCCLMSISLPWEHIAHDLLFKFPDNELFQCSFANSQLSLPVSSNRSIL